MESEQIKFQFDERRNLSWGYWICEACAQIFYDKKISRHKEDCPLKDDNVSYIYHFGLKEVEKTKEKGSSIFGPLTKKILEERFPELWEIKI